MCASAGLNDLDAIRLSLAEESFELAGRIDSEIRSPLLHLADFPGRGNPREGLATLPVRFRAIYACLIVYSPGEGLIEIVRVIQASRDLTGLI